MLAAIFLGDESAPDSGNLWVWPGSHLVHQQLFAERGTRALLAVSGHTFSLDGPPALADSHPILANRGNLLLAHFLLGHNIGGNITDRTRRILHFRLTFPGHQDRLEETFLNSFSEYPPIQATAR